MDRLAQLSAFITTVERGGMAAAARALDVPRAKVSRHIQELEAALGVQLLVRTTRALRLTEAGAGYFESARDALSALSLAELRVREGFLQPRGTLRLNAPMSFGIIKLSPLLPAFRALYPDVALHLVLSDELLDPVRGDFDLTLRIAELPDSSLVARRLAAAPLALVASPRYLAEHGAPDHPSALAKHSCLNYGYSQTGNHWTFYRGAESLRVAVSGPICANNGSVLADAAAAGIGIALLPVFLIEPMLQSGRLRPILTDWSAPEIAVHALYPATKQLPLKVRAMIDFLAAAWARDNTNG
jgi:DNA-binding transcriptional LysR family regulator